MDKATNVTLSFQPEVRKLLGALSEFENRSLSAIVRRLIENEFATRRREIEAWKRARAKNTATKWR